MLRDYRFSDDVDDIRGSALYGADGDKLGKIDDVIFDHASGTIQYAVVDTGGWLSSKKFLVPADRIHPDAKNHDDFAIDATKEQIEALPKYDENAMQHDARLERLRQALSRGMGQRAGAAKGRQHAHHHARGERDAGGHGLRRRATRPTCRTDWRESLPEPARSQQAAHAAFGSGSEGGGLALAGRPSSRRKADAGRGRSRRPRGAKSGGSQRDHLTRSRRRVCFRARTPRALGGI